MGWKPTETLFPDTHGPKRDGSREKTEKDGKKIYSSDISSCMSMACMIIDVIGWIPKGCPTVGWDGHSVVLVVKQLPVLLLVNDNQETFSLSFVCFSLFPCFLALENCAWQCNGLILLLVVSDLVPFTAICPYFWHAGWIMIHILLIWYLFLPSRLRGPPIWACISENRDEKSSGAVFIFSGLVSEAYRLAI